MVEWIPSPDPQNKNNMYPSDLSAAADRPGCCCQLLSEASGLALAALPALPQAEHRFPCARWCGWFVSFSLMDHKAPERIARCALSSPMNMEESIHQLRAQGVFLFHSQLAVSRLDREQEGARNPGWVGRSEEPLQSDP